MLCAAGLPRACGELSSDSVMEATEPVLFSETSCLQKENSALTLACVIPIPRITEFCLPKGYEYSLSRKDICGWARPSKSQKLYGSPEIVCSPHGPRARVQDMRSHHPMKEKTVAEERTTARTGVQGTSAHFNRPGKQVFRPG